MGIKWAPWFNVPLHCRLEVLAVGFLLFCGYFSAVFATIAIIYFLVKVHLDFNKASLKTNCMAVNFKHLK